MAKKVEVKFEANAIGFQRGIESMERGMDSLRAKASRLSGALGAAFALLGAGRSVTRAQEVVRASESTGIDPVSIQAIDRTMRLDNAADTADMLKEFQAKQAEVLQLGAGTATEGFALLGLTPKQLDGMAPGVLFEEVVRRGSKLPQGSQRAFLEELGLGSDDAKNRLFAAFNDPTFLRRLEQARSDAASPQSLLSVTTAQERGQDVVNSVLDNSVEAIGTTVQFGEDAARAPGEFAKTMLRDTVRQEPGRFSVSTPLAEFYAQQFADNRDAVLANEARQARLEAMGNASPAPNTAFTRPEDYDSYVNSGANEEIRRAMREERELLQRQLEALEKIPPLLEAGEMTVIQQ